MKRHRFPHAIDTMASRHQVNKTMWMALLAICMVFRLLPVLPTAFDGKGSAAFLSQICSSSGTQATYSALNQHGNQDKSQDHGAQSHCPWCHVSQAGFLLGPAYAFTLASVWPKTAFQFVHDQPPLEQARWFSMPITGPPQS